MNSAPGWLRTNHGRAGYPEAASSAARRRLLGGALRGGSPALIGRRAPVCLPSPCRAGAPAAGKAEVGTGGDRGKAMTGRFPASPRLVDRLVPLLRARALDTVWTPRARLGDHRHRQLELLAALEVLIDVVRRRSPASTRIIVVDNGSGDESRARLAELRTSRPWFPFNVGHELAMDIGVLLAETEFVVALDVDAFPLHDDWLEELLAPLDTGRQVSGARLNRQYVHPCCWAMRNRPASSSGDTPSAPTTVPRSEGTATPPATSARRSPRAEAPNLHFFEVTEPARPRRRRHRLRRPRLPQLLCHPIQRHLRTNPRRGRRRRDSAGRGTRPCERYVYWPAAPRIAKNRVRPAPSDTLMLEDDGPGKKREGQQSRRQASPFDPVADLLRRGGQTAVRPLKRLPRRARLLEARRRGLAVVALAHLLAPGPRAASQHRLPIAASGTCATRSPPGRRAPPTVRSAASSSGISLRHSRAITASKRRDWQRLAAGRRSRS